MRLQTGAQYVLSNGYSQNPRCTGGKKSINHISPSANLSDLQFQAALGFARDASADIDILAGGLEGEAAATMARNSILAKSLPMQEGGGEGTR